MLSRCPFHCNNDTLLKEEWSQFKSTLFTFSFQFCLPSSWWSCAAPDTTARFAIFAQTSPTRSRRPSYPLMTKIRRPARDHHDVNWIYLYLGTTYFWDDNKSYYLNPWRPFTLILTYRPNAPSTLVPQNHYVTPPKKNPIRNRNMFLSIKNMFDKINVYRRWEKFMLLWSYINYNIVNILCTIPVRAPNTLILISIWVYNFLYNNNVIH